MASPNETADLKIQFIIESKYNSEKECSMNMWHAFNKCDELDTKPVWILEKDCLELQPEKTDVFVIETFSGEVFEYLKKFKCSILGPRCLLKCFTTGDPLPPTTSPVLNTAMENIVVSLSGFPVVTKEELKNKVEYMGGVFLKTLRNCVTHLVTNSVMSAKYEAATKSGLTVVKQEWINAIWEANLNEFVPANDPRFDCYKCPIFFNLIVTTTNIPSKIKEELKQAMKNNGGECLPVLDGSKVKIVLTTSVCRPSEKLTFAQKRNIPCLKYDWVYDSIKEGYSLPLDDYIIIPPRKCSTPEKNEGTFADYASIDISRISTATFDENAVIHETMQSTMSGMTSIMTSAARTKTQFDSASYEAILDKMDVEGVKNKGTFLDGCGVYLLGFTISQRDKVIKLLGYIGAVILDEPTDDTLTHVIVGDVSKAVADIQFIKTLNTNPSIVNIKWLRECIKVKKMAFEDDFLIEPRQVKRKSPPKKNNIEPASPLSKKSMVLLKPKSLNLSTSQTIQNLTSTDSGNPPEEDSEETDLVMKYLKIPECNSKLVEVQENEKSTLINESKKIVAVQENEKLTVVQENKKSIDIQDNKRSTSILTNQSKPLDTELSMSTADVDTSEGLNVSTISFSQDPNATSLFKGHTFVVAKFSDEDKLHVIKMIKLHGGKMAKLTEIPDFGVVPVNGTLERNVKKLVTNLYIEECVDECEIVEVKYYHYPVVIPNHIKPLKDCVIAMSSYANGEREFLQNLAESLGARYQDTFARTTKVDQNTHANTHLVCPDAQGKKYSAAIRWKIPVVTSKWLLACAKKGIYVDEDPYLVGSSVVPDHFSETLKKKENITNSNDPILTMTSAENEKTPNTKIINKRLQSVMGNKPPQSPFHVDTPNSPYGRIFKDNPSPETRKKFLKWVNQFPEWQEPPVTKKTRDSTPFSDLKKRLMEKCVKESEIAAYGELKDSVSLEEQESPPVIETQIKRKLSYSEAGDVDTDVKDFKHALRGAYDCFSGMSSDGNNLSDTENVEQVEKRKKLTTTPVLYSQCDVIGWEQEQEQEQAQEHEQEQQKCMTSKDEVKKKFMISGIKIQQDLETLKEMILNLGGEISDTNYFDSEATHLLSVKAVRNEKMLSSIAAGKWVLHVNYVLKSDANGTFLNEEDFEFGNPKSKSNIPSANVETERLIGEAAYRWRTKLSKQPGGAFKDMVALLLVHADKYDQFERLITAGGGTVVNERFLDDSILSGGKITHCFVQPKQVDQPIEWAKLASKGILCFSPQYLSDQLASESPLSPRECVVPEFRKFLSLMPT